MKHLLGHHHKSGTDPFAPVAIPTALWIGNLTFLCTLHLSHANEFGLIGFFGSMTAFMICGWLNRSTKASSPFAAGWNALTFWLTYNLQRNSNPNIFQCMPWLREPLVRFGIVGAAITVLSLSLLHLSGVHASKCRNRPAPQLVVWRHLTPQGYPKVVATFGVNDQATAIYDRWSEQLVMEGDAPLPPRKPVRTLGDLMFSAVLFFLGGPLAFVLLLVTMSGNFLAEQMAGDEAPSEEP